MTHHQALVPQIIIHTKNQSVSNLVSIFIGVVSMSLLAQLTIPLSWTPVPITGQTFGVALISLLWGRKRAIAVMSAYLSAGAMGLPVFANAKSGLSFGPTSGYLIGMFAASFFMGSLADLGFTKTFLKSWLAAFLGSVITFFFGILVLSFFVPHNQLFAAGVYPFLPGDCIKTLAASFLANKTFKYVENRL